MFEGSSWRDSLAKLGATALGILVITVATSAGVHGLTTGKNLITSMLGLVFAAGMTALLGYSLWRWALPIGRRARQDSFLDRSIRRDAD